MASWAFGPFAAPTSSFTTPVEPPVVQGGSCSDMTVTFPSEWLPYIIEALTQLTLQSTWLGDQAIIEATQEKAWFIIRSIQQALCVTGPETPGSCCGDDEMGCCSLRFKDGVLQCMCGGVWQDVTGQQPGQAQPGAGSPLPPANGGSQEYCFGITALAGAFLPAVVNTGDVIQLSALKGAWNDGNSLFWYCPNGYQFLLGQCSFVAVQNQGQQLVTARYMQIIAKIGTVLYDVLNVDGNGNPQPFVVPGGVINQPVEFLCNSISPSVLPVGGVVEFCATVTNNTAGVFVHTFDFTLGAVGWIPANNGNGALAHLVAGIGWESVSGVDGPNDTQTDIQRDFGATRITSVEVFYVTDQGNGIGGSRAILYRSGGGLLNYGALNTGTGTFDTAISNNIAGVNQLYLSVDRDQMPFGNFKITKCIVAGIGIDPF